MGSKSALGHQNDIEKGEKRAEGVLGASWERLGATREAHWGPRTAFWRPNGGADLWAGVRGGATGSLRLRI